MSALILSLTPASHQVENQTCLKIACSACAICLAVEGSKSCGHSAALQSDRISSLITDKFTPLLVIKIVNVYYQMQKKQPSDIKSTSKETSLPGLFQSCSLMLLSPPASAAGSYVIFIAFTCLSVLPNVCITYCNWSIFIPYFLIIFFQCHLRNLNSLCVYFHLVVTAALLLILCVFNN